MTATWCLRGEWRAECFSPRVGLPADMRDGWNFRACVNACVCFYVCVFVEVTFSLCVSVLKNNFVFMHFNGMVKLSEIMKIFR